MSAEVPSSASFNVDVESGHGSMPQYNILDPQVSQTKGRRKDPKGKDIVQSSCRMKSGLELSTKKNLRKCKTCLQFAWHDSRNCPKNPNRRKRNLEGVQQGDHADSGEDVG